MSDQPTRLTLQVSDDSADPEQIEAWTVALRRELLELDVAAVDPLPGEPAPPGSRGAGMVALGALVVSLSNPDLLASVVSTVQSWIDSRRERSVRLVIGDDVLELHGLSSRQQQRLAEEWLRRHAEG